MKYCLSCHHAFSIFLLILIWQHLESFFQWLQINFRLCKDPIHFLNKSFSFNLFKPWNSWQNWKYGCLHISSTNYILTFFQHQACCFSFILLLQVFKFRTHLVNYCYLNLFLFWILFLFSPIPLFSL